MIIFGDLPIYKNALQSLKEVQQAMDILNVHQSANKVRMRKRSRLILSLIARGSVAQGNAQDDNRWNKYLRKAHLEAVALESDILAFTYFTGLNPNLPARKKVQDLQGEILNSLVEI